MANNSNHPRRVKGTNGQMAELGLMLYEALSAQFGLAVESTDPHVGMARLAEAKYAIGDPLLAGLQFRIMPCGLIAICKPGVGPPKRGRTNAAAREAELEAQRIAQESNEQP